MSAESKTTVALTAAPKAAAPASEPSATSTFVAATTVAVPPQEQPSVSSAGDSKSKPCAGTPNKLSTNPKKLTHLVIDAGAIIKGAGMTLASASENFWTVPEVVAEIRDKKARHHLQTLPFELKLREPSDEAMKFAAGFARQTGDLRSLSRVDLKVIALTYMLERQETGAAHLRTKPSRPGTKVNSKNKAVATNTLPSQTQGQTVDATHATATDASASATSNQINPGSSSGQPLEMSSDEGKNDADGMDALCAVVKQVWTMDVPGGTDAKSNAAGKAPAADSTADLAMEEKERAGGNGGGGVVHVVMTKGSEEEEQNTSDDELEEEAQVDGEDVQDEHAGEQLDSENDHAHDDDDDDEWEPEDPNDNDANGEDAPLTPATESPEDVKKSGGQQEAFAADDFPALGGTPTPTPGSAPAFSQVDPSPSSSWSVMARSNPAPFKATVQADPKPLPAATVAHESNTAGHFATAAPAAPGPRPDGAVVGASRILNTASAFGVVSGVGAEIDDGAGWVNPSNFKTRKMAGIGLNGPLQSQQKGGKGMGGGRGAASKCRAGCVTTDFAMQNVILQVGLPLLSLDGMAVRRVKQWILRCSACFKTSTEMGRLFCPVCGNACLDRVSCSVDAKSGATRVHLRKNHKVNLRGSKFSIPAPDPTKGRFEGDLLLREDQLLSGIWAQKARRKEKDISSMFGENITGNVGLTVSKSADIVVGYGRKNPNSARGRERRGKKSVKKRL